MRSDYIPLIAVACSACAAIVYRKPSYQAHYTLAACSRACSGKLAGLANKGRRYTPAERVVHGGYVRVRHPVTGRWVKEHRLIAEQRLGRTLRPDEFVHHINHVKTDNRWENLRVMTPAEHMSHHHRGEHHAQAKLTQVMVTDLRARYAVGDITQQQFCVETGLAKGQISSILSGKAWADSAYQPPCMDKYRTRRKH